MDNSQIVPHHGVMVLQNPGNKTEAAFQPLETFLRNKDQ